MRFLGCTLVFLFLLVLLACSYLPSTPTPDVGLAVTQTLSVYTQAAVTTQMAQTLAAAMTQLAAGSATPAPSSTPTDTAIPPSPTPAEFAPNPLPAAYTGVVLHMGECFNFDNGQTVASPDAQCDIWLIDPGYLHQQNGAHVSGYVTLEPPSRTYCAGVKYESGDLAIQTDMYYCFITNEGRVGFIVPRQYLSIAPLTGFVFDYWIFP